MGGVRPVTVTPGMHIDTITRQIVENNSSNLSDSTPDAFVQEQSSGQPAQVPSVVDLPHELSTENIDSASTNTELSHETLRPVSSEQNITQTQNALGNRHSRSSRTSSRFNVCTPQ